MFEEEINMDGATALQVALNTVLQAGAQSLADRISMSGAQGAISDSGSIVPVGSTAANPLGGLALGGSALLGLGGLLGRAGATALGVIRSAGGRILGWILPSGRKVTRRAAVNMAKQFGLVSAAAALGATVEDLAQAVLDEEAKPRRGRGITAAQLRTTRRTIGKVERAHKQLAKLARAHVR